MEINKSGAKMSAIIGIGQLINRLKTESGKDYLALNRGINDVVNIDIQNIITKIDFNSDDLQHYNSANGRFDLKQAINKVYFKDFSKMDRLFVTAGGMNALSLIMSILQVKKIYTPKYFWGAYINIMTINGIAHDTYENFDFKQPQLSEMKGQAIIICDPSNPLGNKLVDEDLLNAVRMLKTYDITVIWDSPYRRLFFEPETDDLYVKLLEFDNVIISESFSKSVGLSGQRIGFVHSLNEDFNREFFLRLLYNTNGVNAFAQILVEKILTTPEGKVAMKEFQQKTVSAINKNVQFLSDNNLLPFELYKNKLPVGIFAVINKTHDNLLKNRIGSVPFDFFTLDKAKAKNYSRICVSVDSERFISFFKTMLSSENE